MNFQSKANKFVCPNDRQLSLRAKLRTGWSAARSEPPLTAAEREAIADVVRRAEQVDEVEAKRIGRLRTVHV
ncbi:unnamed protein product [Leptidea sinapis]|uniref:RabBD domain-containing protein n=1 Tax=Leptidea sinapis TaxID=189913 RepID=A0A5E4QDR9_9NEOP|nr:unnamed protein product [Leptidea sinapis]